MASLINALNQNTAATNRETSRLEANTQALIDNAKASLEVGKEIGAALGSLGGAMGALTAAGQKIAEELDLVAQGLGGGPDELRIVFHLGRPTKQTGEVAKTPQFQNSDPSLENVMPQVEFDLADDDDIVLTIDPAQIKDRKGNPATLDGAPVWSTDNSDIVTLQPADDGLSCKVSAVGAFGDATIFVHGDGRQGPDVKDVVGSAIAHVKLPGDAVDITLVPGTPTKQP
jgi:hypothetical protein